MKHVKRKRKLVLQGLQMGLIGCFLSLTAVGLLMEAMLLVSHVSSLAASLPMGGHMLSMELPSLLWKSLLYSFLVLVPMTVGVGILATFRFAGPAYKLERHLRAIARGEDPGACQLRSGDDLQDLCEALNEAVETLRRDTATEGEADRRSDRAA